MRQIASTATFLGLSNAFSIADNRTGVACPYAPAPLPQVDPQTHQLQFFLAAATLNCAIWVPYVNGAIDWALPSSVAFWGKFIPQLNQMFPGMSVCTPPHSTHLM